MISKRIYLAIISLMVLCCSGCALTFAAKWGNAELAYSSSFADVRNNQKNAATQHPTAGVAVDVYKDPISKQAAHMVETVLPEIVEQAVKAALYSSVIQSIPGLGGDADEVVGEIVPEAAEACAVGETISD